MKLIHLSDLHIGKKLEGNNSLLEDQEYILNQILDIVDDEKPQGVMIAGDVYDIASPSGEAMQMFSRFVAALMKKNIPVFTVSGNHDSSKRIAYGSEIFSVADIHMSPVYAENSVKPITLEDSYGPVNVYMMPFVKPAHVRAAYPDDPDAQAIQTYTDAMRFAVSKMNVDFSKRNVLIAHQYVTGSERSDSEETNIGTLDNVDASAFDGFDYVALGHLHRPQNCGGCNHIRYCGTPLKYSLSEVNNPKSVTIVELGEKGNVSYTTRDLKPIRDCVVLKGTFEELMNPAFYTGKNYQSDYVYIKLTDENLIPNVSSRLHAVYKNIVNISYECLKSKTSASKIGTADVDRKSPMELFSDLFKAKTGQELTETEREIAEKIFKRVQEDNE